MFDALKNFIWLFILIAVLLMSPRAYAKANYDSFVDSWINNELVFEEDPADEFINEKRELNKKALAIIQKKNFDKSSFVEEIYQFQTEFKELINKEEELYGKDYLDLDGRKAFSKILFRASAKVLEDKFPCNISGYDKIELQQKLREETTWKNFDNNTEQLTKLLEKFLDEKIYLPPEISFMLNKKVVTVCQEALGESDPITLKNILKLIRDYSELGDSKTALNMEKNLLPQIKKTFGEESIETATVLNLMANDYRILGNYGKSEETFLKLIDIDKKIYGEENSPELLSSLVGLINLRGVFLKSDDPLYIALEKAAKDIPEDDLYRRGYFRTKALNSELYNYNTAAALDKILKKEKDLIKSNANNMKLVEGLFVLSKIYKELGLYSDALDYDLANWAICKERYGNYHYATLMAQCNLSDDYLSINQIDDALSLSQMAITTSRKIYGDEHPCTIYALHTLTNAYRKMNRYEDALNLDKKSYELCKKIFVKDSQNEPIEKLVVATDIFKDHMGLKNYKIIVKYCNENILNQVSTNRFNYISTAAEVLNTCMHFYNLTGEYKKTVEAYNFLKVNDGSYVATMLPIKGLYLCHTANTLGDALAAVGKNKDAASCYRVALNEFEVLRKYNERATDEYRQQWFSDVVPTYKKAAPFFITQGYDLMAFQSAELCKARVLTDYYRDLVSMYQCDLSKEDIQTLTDYRTEISNYQDKFKDELKNGSNNLKLNLRFLQLRQTNNYFSYRYQIARKYPKYKEMMFDYSIDTNVFESDKRKSIVKQNNCYISFSVLKKEDFPNKSSDEILAFVVDETGTITGNIIPVDENFFHSCKVYHELLAYFNVEHMNQNNSFLWEMPDGNYKITENLQPPTGATFINTAEGFDEARQKLSEQLGEKLLAPLNDNISTKATWIISPDGELSNIPFETLHFNGKLAIESKDISYVPSLAVLNLMQEMGEKNSQLQNRKELFAMGNAVYGGTDYAKSRGLQIEFFQNIKQRSTDSYVDLTQIKWNDLPGTGEELNQVSKLFSVTSQEILTGINASEKILKRRDEDGDLSKYKYILFATHGLFVPKKPELSSIVLSQELVDENYDGYVTISELFSYHLNSDLIYLSACESGRGDYQTGEGIVGLPYALTIAGNKDTVMSLWKIDDEAATKFATVFFTKLRDGKSELQALNETKREFLSDSNPKLNNPSAWAAFLLYGI